MTSNPSASAVATPRRESTTHWIAHHAVVFARPIFLIFLGATVVLMATVWPVAILTGLVALACGVVLLIGREVEDRSEAGDSGVIARNASGALEVGRRGNVGAVASTDALDVDPPETTHVPGGEIDTRLLLRESRTVAGIVIAIVSLAVILGLALFEWPMLFLGIGVVAMYGAFISFPAWAAWLGDDAEAAAKRLEEEEERE